MEKERCNLCEKIASIDDELKPSYFVAASDLASAMGQQEPSWECLHKQTDDPIEYNFTRKEKVHRVHVILIEDDDALRESLKAIMETESRCTVTAVADGNMAIKLLTHNKYEFLFTDINIPGPSGLDVLAFAREFHPKVKAYVITAHTRYAYKERAKELGAIEFIEKPFDPEYIINLIRQPLLPF